MLDIKKLVWILVCLVLISSVCGQEVLSKEDMVKYSKNRVDFVKKDIVLTNDVVNGNCFELPNNHLKPLVCFKVNNGLVADFYYKEYENKIKFGWQIIDKTYPDEIEIESNVNLEELNIIDWSDFDDTGVEYEFEENKIKIKNAQEVNGWFDPVIETSADGATHYNNQPTNQQQ